MLPEPSLSAPQPRAGSRDPKPRLGAVVNRCQRAQCGCTALESFGSFGRCCCHGRKDCVATFSDFFDRELLDDLADDP